SYGIVESLNLFVPRLFGGSNSEDLGENSKTYDFLIDQGISRRQALDFSKSLPLYWGNQPATAGPAYIGSIIFFLFILGLILVKKKTKWWLLGGVLVSLVLSWGKNFGLLTDFMIDYFPLYNKFRAVSSIQVILELCAPVLAILALKEIIDSEVDKSKKIQALKISLFTILGIVLALLLLKGAFSFESFSDETLKRYYGDEILSLIQLDRKAVYTNDLFRSLIFIVLAAAVLWLYLKQRLKENILLILLGVFIVVDLVGVDKRYVNKEDFVSKRSMSDPFPEKSVDKQILQDESIYRVYNPQEGLNGASTSFFHKSIGGYHAAKPAGLQDLFDFYIYKGKIEILNMLNVKYVIQQDEEGNSAPAMNPDANGNAWFVSKLIEVKSADEEISALDNLDVKNEAVVNTARFENVNRFNFHTDSLANVSLVDYEPNHLTYRATNPNAGVLVFSEMYYENGWNAYIDGQAKDHFRVNYVLRALHIPDGDHTIEFKFEPPVIKHGSQITLASSIILGLIVLLGIGYSFWRPSKNEENE
ncbi:MAG: YfhO family protein, partial [Maribacter sp.]|nr:YfhO family protein [Maribacter sp.]